MDALRIYFRQHQLQDVNDGNANVIVDCSTGTAQYVHGTADQTWVEMTQFTEGLDKFESSWDYINQASTEASATNAAGSNYDKGISLTLSFSGPAFDYIWNWLLTTKCQILNAIDVRIDDVLCGKSFRLFEIKCDNLNYKPEFACQMDVQLREQDLVWHCVHKTFIWDDWQKWFNQDGTSTKQHPTFLTCIEPRPRIMSSVRLALLFFYHANPAIAAFDFLTAGNIKDDVRRILELNNFCPSPLIRDYIDNVAAKCGMTADTIFHREDTPEFNACIFHPLSGQYYEHDADDEVSPSKIFIFENRWDITLAELLDKLKAVYAAEWYVTPNNVVVFKPEAELIDLAPIFDFTDGTYPIRFLDYTFDGTKRPAYGRYQYQADGSDLGSQEISNLYNDLTDFDGPTNNPMFEGELDKEFEFGATAFVRDGRTHDYIKLLIEDGRVGALVLLAVCAVIAAALIAGTVTALAAAILLVTMAIWGTTINGKAANMRDHFQDDGSNYTGAVRLVMANQTLTPRILIWDGELLERAKVVKTNTPPTPNLYYNPDSMAYNVSNQIGTDNAPGNIMNYPVYVDSFYTSNLFDRFHDAVDNPLKSLETNQTFEFETDYCCGVLDLLGLWEDDFVKIGYLLIIERRPNYLVTGRIEHITVSRATMTVKIKGKVIKK